MKLTEGLINKAIALSITIGLVLSALLLWGVGVEDVLARFQQASWGLLIGYLAVSIAIALGVTYKWRIALDAYGVKLPFYTLFIYRLIGFAVSYVTPTAHVGGEPVRALLVGRQGIPYKVSFSAVIVDKLLEVLFNTAMFFIGALIILNSASFPRIARITIFILSLILVSIASIFAYNIFKQKKVLAPFLKRLGFGRRKGWKKIEKSIDEMELLVEHFYAKKRGHFLGALLVNAILWVLMFIEYKIALLILGYDAGLFGIFLFLTGVGIAYSIPIPAGLGVLELGQISAGKLLGLGSSIGIALAFLIRMRDFLWTMIGLLLLSFFHLNIFKLYERSQEAAKKYNFEKLQPELRSIYKEIGEEIGR